MSQQPALERRQVPLYFAVVALAAGGGLAWPRGAGALEHALEPAIALLLLTMFLQLPLDGLRRGLGEGRFVAAILVTNFVALPPLVWGLTRLLDGDPVLVVAALLVLLVPCTDWSIVFAGLGGGSARLMVSVLPMLLGLQLVLLPLYLWLFAGPEVAAVVDARPFLLAFAFVIALPLSLAALAERLARSSERAERTVAGLARLPVALTALVLFLVVASQIDVAREAGSELLSVVGLFIAFPLLALLVAWLVGRVAGLGAAAHRTVAFSASTRNSFVVLPLALALPEGAELAAAVIVTQAMIELVAMVVFVRLVPGWAIPGRADASARRTR